MLELKKINKSYKTGSFTQRALKDVSIEFRKNEFVAILGQSGSGKTTLLNIIGGLDRYDSGDLIINNKSTKKFKNIDWDRYRNNCVGFIFQSYNLIPHITILDNVEMGMTLSGVNSRTRKRKAKAALKKVGLLEHIHKKPNQLSGGQMQRVAIARALVNDPEIILADEPTGALDTKTSVQIMDLIKEIAEDKLVIMVTHNPDLAKTYANRIIEFKDGEAISDSNPVKEIEKDDSNLKIKKTAMSFLTALKLSFNNIKTKKGRTLITAFASSIGIIGIGLILALSNGFKIEIDNFEKDTLSQAPVMISTQAANLSNETMKQLDKSNLEKYTDKKVIYAEDDPQSVIMHTNVLTDEFIEYVKNIDIKLLSGVSYQSVLGFTLINKTNDTYNQVITTATMAIFPYNPNGGETGIIYDNYDIIAGSIDDNNPGLIIQVDNKNRLYKSSLSVLGVDSDSVSFDEILNKELKIVFNDDYYKNVGGFFIPETNYEKLYNHKNSVSVKVQAIIRGKEDKELITSGTGLGYNNALSKLVISKNKDSKIVKAQRKADYNILTNQMFDEVNTKKAMLEYLGDDVGPSSINLYPKDFDSKKEITDYLDKYNEGKDEQDRIEYMDMASMISSLSGSIMDAITIVLIAFSSISLVVSSIMIAIITYISVLERTKEIGILRALGARKKDIKRVFNAETFIIGITSGLLGILIAYLLTFPVNSIIYNVSNLPNVAKLNPIHATILIAINVTLTMLGGFIPAKIASKKDPVEALRTE